MLGHVVWIGMVREGLWLEGGIVPRFGAGARDVRGTRGTQRERRVRKTQTQR